MRLSEFKFQSLVSAVRSFSGMEIKPRFGNAATQEDIERNLRQLLKETEIIQQGPEISDRKSVLFLVPPANTLFELFGDWLFTACHQVGLDYTQQGTMKEALKIIGKIVTKFRGPVDQVYLALYQMHLKRFFHDRALSNSVNDYRELMGSAETLFSQDIPGIRSLAPLFLDKIIDALSQEKATFELKSSAVRLLSQLICLAGNLRDDKRTLEGELAKKKEEQLHTVFEFKQKLGTLNLEQLVFGLKQLDAKLFSTALWVYVVYLQANFQPVVLSEFITRLIQEVLEPKILTHLFSDPISILCHTIFNIIAYTDWILCRSEGGTSSTHLSWIMKLTEYLKYLYNIFKENGLQTAKTLCKSLILTILRLLMMHPLQGRGVIIQNFLEVLLKITALTKGSLRDFAHFSFSFLEAHWNRIVPSSQTTCSLSSVLDAKAELFFADRGIYLLINDTKLLVAVEQPHPTAFNDLLLLVRDSHGRFVYRTQLLLDCQRVESALREETTNVTPREPPPPLGYYLEGSRHERHRGSHPYEEQNEKQVQEEDDLLLETIDNILQANIKIENEYLRRDSEESKINYEERYDQSMINHNQGSVLRVLLAHLGLIDAFESKVSILDKKNEQMLSDIAMLDQISEKIAHQIPVLYIEKPECLLLNGVTNQEAHHAFQDFLSQLGPKITEQTLVTGLFQEEAKSVLKRYQHFHHFSDIFNDLYFVAPSTLEGVSLKQVKALSNVAIVWNARVSGPAQNNKTPLLVEDLLKHPSGKLIVIITPLEFRLFCLSVLIKRGKEFQELESLAGQVGPITEGMIVPKALLGPLITHTCLAFLRYDYSSPSYSYSGYGVFGEKVPDKFEDATVAALIDKYRRREECIQSLKKYSKNTSQCELIKLLQETERTEK